MADYFPYKAGCRQCRHQDTDKCQTLDFSRMPPKRRDGATISVDCKGFESKFRSLIDTKPPASGVQWK